MPRAPAPPVPRPLRPRLLATLAAVVTSAGCAAGAEAQAPVPEEPLRWDLRSRLEDGPVLPPGTPMAGVIPEQRRGGYAAEVLTDTGVRDAPGGRKRLWVARRRTPHTGNATRLTVQLARFDAAGRSRPTPPHRRRPRRPRRRCGRRPGSSTA